MTQERLNSFVVETPRLLGGNKPVIKRNFDRCHKEMILCIGCHRSCFLCLILFLPFKNIYIVAPPNSNTFSDWRRTCHGSWGKTRLLARETKAWTFDSHVIRSCSLKPRQVWVRRHNITGPAGNSTFSFPSTSMFPSALPRRTLRVSGKTHCFPWGRSFAMSTWSTSRCLKPCQA